MNNNNTASRSKTILETIQNNPGIHVNGLIKKTGFENGVLVHYLEKIRKKW